MKTHWERQIAHIDRNVGPLEWPGARKQLRKADVRKRRGLPSRNVSVETVFDLLDLRVAASKGKAPDPDFVAKRQWRLIRERLLERKQALRWAARKRVRVNDTRINLWRRRREWLRAAETGDLP